MIRKAWRKSGGGDIDVKDFPSNDDKEVNSVIGYCVKQAIYNHLPSFERLDKSVREVL